MLLRLEHPVCGAQLQVLESGPNVDAVPRYSSPPRTKFATNSTTITLVNVGRVHAAEPFDERVRRRRGFRATLKAWCVIAPSRPRP